MGFRLKGTGMRRIAQSSCPECHKPLSGLDDLRAVPGGDSCPRCGVLLEWVEHPSPAEFGASLEMRQRIDRAVEDMHQQISCLLDSLDEDYRRWGLQSGAEASATHAAVMARLRG